RRGARAALGGAAGSAAVLELIGVDGESGRVEVPRGPAWTPPRPPGNPWRWLRPPTAGSKGIGYVDLNWLQTSEVTAMLAELGEGDALVLDMRGYPNGTAWPLAARLNSRGAAVGAQFRGREVDPGSFRDAGEGGYFFEQPLPG